MTFFNKDYDRKIEAIEKLDMPV